MKKKVICKQCQRAERRTAAGVRAITVNAAGICPACVSFNEETAARSVYIKHDARLQAWFVCYADRKPRGRYLAATFDARDFTREQVEAWIARQAQLALAAAPAHCCACPHESYLTISVKRREHECSSCGAIFIEQREARYFGREAER